MVCASFFPASLFLSQRVGLRYITAITKPRIETLLFQELFTMSLFDPALAEAQQDKREYACSAESVDEFRLG
jgi:hypothetical protein